MAKRRAQRPLSEEDRRVLDSFEPVEKSMSLQGRIDELKRKRVDAEKNRTFIRLSQSMGQSIIADLEQLQQIRKKVPEVTEAINKLHADITKEREAAEVLLEASSEVMVWLASLSNKKPGGVRASLQEKLAHALALVHIARL